MKYKLIPCLDLDEKDRTQKGRRPGRGSRPGLKGTAAGTHRSKRKVIMRNSRTTEGGCV